MDNTEMNEEVKTESVNIKKVVVPILAVVGGVTAMKLGYRHIYFKGFEAGGKATQTAIEHALPMIDVNGITVKWMRANPQKTITIVRKAMNK